MLHHISLPVSNLSASKKLYDVALLVLGYKCVCSGIDFAGYGIEENRDKFSIKQTAQAKSAGPGFHLALSAPNRLAVDRFFKEALENGAKGNGPPGLRRQYGPDYYAAFIIDLDGHRIEAVINEPDSSQ